MLLQQRSIHLRKPSLFLLRRFISYDQHESPKIPQHFHRNFQLDLTQTLPASCHILIAGGGILGQSIAYHLSQIGVRDVVLIEKAKLASGSTWQSAGQCAHIQNTLIQTHFVKYSRDLYRQLQSQGHDIGFSQKGSLWLAQTSDRLHTLKRQYAIIKALGINCEILNVEKIQEKLPMIDPHEIWVRN